MGAQPTSIDFARSPRSSVGIEWELALVDRGSGELVPLADDVLAAARLPEAPNGPQLTREFLTNTVEIVSGAHARVGGAVTDLGAGLDAVLAASHPLGIDPIGSGTHPFSRWADQEVTDKERYATLVDRARWWGRQMTIWGVHVHVGIERRDKVLPIMNALLTYYPHLQALSASSPFWEGDDTGYASNRALVYQQLPTAGLPYLLDDWAAYERIVGDLRHTGVIEHHSELRWDLRPSPGWGTLEVRICDGLPTLREVAVLAALVQCLVEHLSERLDRGEPLEVLPPWYLRENKWRAARYGMDTILIRNRAGDERLVTEDLAELLETLRPIAERLGCSAELDDAAVILEHGASYQRQLRVAERSGGDARAVVGALAAELRAGTPSA
ncbi:MAG: glutamate--cysteine ligase [Microbacteriaceae bacterium]